MLKCVIFDLDGTLADTMPLCVAAFRASVEQLAGVTLTDSEIYAAFGPSEEGTITSLLPAGTEKGIDAFLAQYEALHTGMCSGPFPGIPELLAFLREKGVHLALVTGKGRHSADISLRLFGMEGTFEAIETGDPAGPCKPLGIRNVLAGLHIAPTEALYVGDVVSDILACREVGVPILAAAWASTADAEALARHNPDVLCHTVDAARTYIEALLKG